MKFYDGKGTQYEQDIVNYHILIMETLNLNHTPISATYF